MSPQLLAIIGTFRTRFKEMTSFLFNGNRLISLMVLHRKYLQELQNHAGTVKGKSEACTTIYWPA